MDEGPGLPAPAVLSVLAPGPRQRTGMEEFSSHGGTPGCPPGDPSDAKLLLCMQRRSCADMECCEWQQRLCWRQ